MELKSWLRGWRWSLPKLAALGCIGLGCLMLLAALAAKWMAVPTGGGGLRDAAATNVWKVLFIAGLTVAALLALRSQVRGLMRVLALMIPLVLAFPQAVIVGDADTSGDLAWLQQQHDSLTWLGGDVYLAHGMRYQGTAPSVDLEDPPMRLAAFRPPTASPWSLGIAELPDLVWWFGYNPAFCQFVAKGWVLAWLGLVLVLAGLLGWRRRDDARGSRGNDFRACAGALSAGLLLWLAVGVVPIVGASHFLKSARAAAMNDDPQGGRRALERACGWMPALRFDSGVIAQAGTFDRACGEPAGGRARLKGLLALEEADHQHRAAIELERLIADGGHDRALDRELSRMLLRMAIDDFNSGRVAGARRRLRMVCEREPLALQARFHLQLCSLRGGSVEENRRCREEVEAIYGAFQRKEKKGVLAASWLMLAQGELEVGDVAAAGKAREKSRKL